VDNVTHAFVGAAMAECAAPAGVSTRTRAAMIGVGVCAANAPDVDLLYTRITEPPLGYLLHHRGHSHTLAGLAALLVLIWSGTWLIQRARSASGVTTSRGLALIAAALASHLLMDGANSYGTHPLWPFSARWLYLDAVFVLEPWLWTILGVALALNGNRAWRTIVGALVAILLAGVAAIRLVPLSIVLLMIVAAVTAGMAARTWSARRRATAALIATALIFGVMPFVSRLAKVQARAALDGAVPIDIVADANPGVPWCWSVLTLQKDDGGEALVARRGTLSLVPRLWPASACASTRLSGQANTEVAASAAMIWHQRWQIDLDGLRSLAAHDCRAAAWLQYGRVPYISGGTIADLRFERPMRGNFTRMRLDAGGSGCPANLTSWTPPRADILRSAH
jgi:inner membrane protein